MGDADVLRRIRERGLIRLVAFDLDGTLVDSRRDIADAVNDLIVERGALALAEEAIGRMVGDGASVLVARAFSAAGLTYDDSALDRFLALYDARLLGHTRPYPGVVDLLAALESRATLAVLTNKPIAPTRQILEGLGLARWFTPERVLGGDGPLARKPDPAGLLRLAAEAGATPGEVLMVGDSVVDWRTARAAGSRACLVRWGIGFEAIPQADLTADDVVIDAPHDLLRFV